MSETRALASYVVNGRWADIPADVQHEARRALVNYVGCALGGARDEAVELALRALAPFSGPPTAAVLGRDERLDPLHASLMNGISSHVYDYDDTTPKNYSHPSSPVASALFAYASANRVSGRQFIEAFVFGFEAESRVANAVYPAHYDAGWHITGTSGVFGAATAIGKLLGLGEQQMVWAIGLAATQAAGLREMFGSMAKSFHPGRSAQNGYAAALLAQAGFTAGERGIEGPRGFAAVTAARYDLSKMTDRPRRGLRPARQHLQAVSVRHRQPPDHRRVHPAARGAPHPGGRDRVGAAAGGAAGARFVQPDRHYQGPAGQVLRLSWRRRRPGARQGGDPGVHRRRGERSGGQARSRAGAGGGRQLNHRGPGARHRGDRGRPPGGGVHRRNRSATSAGRSATRSSRPSFGTRPPSTCRRTSSTR